MEDLTERWENFTLSGPESRGIPVASFRNSKGGMLAAKFLTRRNINIEAVARTFKPLWRADKGFTIRDMGDNKALFTFKEETDLERVLQNGPWAYDRSLVVCQRVEDNIPIKEIPFTHILFWVQIHDLPVLSLSTEVSETIGQTLGSVEQAPESIEDNGGGPWMRVRVTIDITKPLCRGRKITLEDSSERWISFKYERLPNFCYWCGKVDHGDKDCSYWLANKHKLKSNDQQYGPWLRATVNAGFRRTSVIVEGQDSSRPTHPGGTRSQAEDETQGAKASQSEQPNHVHDDTEDTIMRDVLGHKNHVFNLQDDSERMEKVAKEALFTAELERIDEELGIGSKMHDQPLTTIEKVAALTRRQDEDSIIPNTITETPVATNSSTSQAETGNDISHTELVICDDTLHALRDVALPGNTSDDTIQLKVSRWKKRARTGTGNSLEQVNSSEALTLSKRSREDIEAKDSVGNSPSKKKQSVEGIETRYVTRSAEAALQLRRDQ
jgi:hypothetical protein